MAKAKGGNIKLEWFGFQEMLDKIEEAEKSVDDAIEKAIKKSAEPIIKDMKEFMEAHSPGGANASPWATGDTLKSWDEKLTKKDGVITYEFGFNIKKGGLPAIFLNYGGFYTKPYLFIEKALDSHIDDVKRLQEEALQEILKELE